MKQNPRFREGIELFNEEKFLEAHEAWEDLWREVKKERPEDADFYRGLIQAAAAFHHARKQNFKGACELFKTSIDYLNQKQKMNCGIRLSKLIGELKAGLKTLQANPEKQIEKFPKIELDNQTLS